MREYLGYLSVPRLCPELMGPHSGHLWLLRSLWVEGLPFHSDPRRDVPTQVVPGNLLDGRCLQQQQWLMG